MRASASYNVETWLPIVANVVRVRLVGGSKNRHGELVGAVEDVAPLRAMVAQRREKRVQRAGGDAPALNWLADYLATDDVIEIGDELRWQGRRFVVSAVDRPELDSTVAFLRARLDEIKS